MTFKEMRRHLNTYCGYEASDTQILSDSTVANFLLRYQAGNIRDYHEGFADHLEKNMRKKIVRNLPEWF